MVLEQGLTDATLLMDGGIIAAVMPGLSYVEGARHVEAGSHVVMPGIIDPHVHINEPGRTEWEGFETATRAALAGGITSLVEMPLNASPVTTTGSAFDEKVSAASGRLHCDCGFWGGVIPGNAGEIKTLVKRGVFGFKAFLTHSGIDEFPNVTEMDLRLVMPVIEAAGLPLLVHCELEGDVGSATGSAAGAGSAMSTGARTAAATGGELGRIDNAGWGDVRSYAAYLASRPRKWENDAIDLMIRLCEETRCPTHIVHLSSSDALPAIRRAKEKGLPLTVETAQHYLYFDAEDIADGATVYKCAPPIRERANRELLWEALEGGLIDFVATDHSPAAPSMKQIDSGDLRRAWGGIASLQLALPVLWSVARERGLGVARLAEWLCEGPARLAGLTGGVLGGAARRGRIAVGARADLVVWDPERSFVVAGSRLYHRHSLTPYEGRQLYGVVGQTWLNGVLCYDNGVFVRPHEGRVMLRGAAAI